MGKLPAFQFYPSDWQNDLNLQLCSLGARGLWIELLCLMHHSEEYGHLLINGTVPDLKTIAKLTRTSLKTVSKVFTELTVTGVLRFTDEQVPYSKRMVEDAKIRATRRECGKLGGNPVLLNQKDNQEDNQGSNQIPTPSSASSSSPSSIKKKARDKRAADSNKTKSKISEATKKSIRSLLVIQLEKVGYKNSTKEFDTRLDDWLTKLIKEADKKANPSGWLRKAAPKRMTENLENFRPDRAERDKAEANDEEKML